MEIARMENDYKEPQQENQNLEENLQKAEEKLEDILEPEDLNPEADVNVGADELEVKEDKQQPEKNPEQSPQQTQVQKQQELSEEIKKKFLVYAEVCYGLEATDQALRGECIDSRLFEQQKDKVEQLEQQKGKSEEKGGKHTSYGKTIKVIKFDEEKEKVEDVWDLFKKLISKQISSGNVFGSISPGVPATVAVNIRGKIFRATFSGVKNPDSKNACFNNVFDVQLQEYYVDKEGKKQELKVGPPLLSDVRVRSNSSTGEVVAFKRGTNIQLSSGRYRDRIYQASALLSIIGKEINNGKIVDKIDPKTNEPVKVKYPQLIIAGTGTGKTGILATAAAAYGSGVFVTKDKKLVQEMVKDINSFVKTDGVVATALPDDFNGDINEYLKEHPYTVMTHSQLLKYADSMKQKKVFIDEVHALCPKSYNKDFKKIEATLQTLMKDNDVLGATGTPTNEVKQVFGGEDAVICNIPLHDIQYKEHMVRQVQSSDVEAKFEESKEFYENSVIEFLAANSPNSIQHTIDKASQQQGLSFWDDPEKARKFYEVLNNLGKNPQLQERINAAALANEEKLIKEMNEGKEPPEFQELPAGYKRDVYGEMEGSQAKKIKYTVMTSIILKLGWVKKQEKDLQELLLLGKTEDIEKYYENSIAQQDKFINRHDGRMKWLKNDLFVGGFNEISNAVKKGMLPTNYDVLMEDKELKNIIDSEYKKQARKLVDGERKGDSYSTSLMKDFKEAMSSSPVDADKLRTGYRKVLSSRNTDELNNFKKLLSDKNFDTALEEYSRVINLLKIPVEEKEKKIKEAASVIETIKNPKPKSKPEEVQKQKGKGPKKPEVVEEDISKKLASMYRENNIKLADETTADITGKLLARVNNIKNDPQTYKKLKDDLILKKLYKYNTEDNRTSYKALYDSYMGVVKKNYSDEKEIAKREKEFTDIALSVAEGNGKDVGNRLKKLEEDFIVEHEKRYHPDWGSYGTHEAARGDERVDLYYATLEKHFKVSTQIRQLQQEHDDRKRTKTTKREVEIENKIKRLEDERDALIKVLEEKRSVAILLLTDPDEEKNSKNTARASAALELCFADFVISNGNLGTGYSNNKLLRLSTNVSKSLKDFNEESKNDIITVLKQQFGRNLRGKGDKGELAITTVMVNSLIPENERPFTAKDLSGPDADNIFCTLMAKFDGFQIEKRKQAKEINDRSLKELQNAVSDLPENMLALKKSVNSLVSKISEDISDDNISQRTPHEVESYVQVIKGNLDRLPEIKKLYDELDALRKLEIPQGDLGTRVSKKVNEIEKLLGELRVGDVKSLDEDIEKAKKKIAAVLVLRESKAAEKLGEKLKGLEEVIKQLPDGLAALRASAEKLFKETNDKLDGDDYIANYADVDEVSRAVENLEKLQKLSEDKFSEPLDKYLAAVKEPIAFLQEKGLSFVEHPEKALEQLEELGKNIASFKDALASNIEGLKDESAHFKDAKGEMDMAAHAYLTTLAQERKYQLVRYAEKLEKALELKIWPLILAKSILDKLQESKEGIDNVLPEDFGLRSFANERLDALRKSLEEVLSRPVYKELDVSGASIAINSELERVRVLEKLGPIAKQLIDQIKLLESKTAAEPILAGSIEKLVEGWKAVLQKLKDPVLSVNLIELTQAIDGATKATEGLDKVAKLDVDRRVEKIEKELELLEIKDEKQKEVQKSTVAMLKKLKEDFGGLTFGSGTTQDFAGFDAKCDAIETGLVEAEKLVISIKEGISEALAKNQRETEAATVIQHAFRERQITKAFAGFSVGKIKEARESVATERDNIRQALLDQESKAEALKGKLSKIKSKQAIAFDVLQKQKTVLEDVLKKEHSSDPAILERLEEVLGEVIGTLQTKQEAEKEQEKLADMIAGREELERLEQERKNEADNKKAADIEKLQRDIDRLLYDSKDVPRDEGLRDSVEKTLVSASELFIKLKVSDLTGDEWDKEVKQINDKIGLAKAIEESKNGHALAQTITELRKFIKPNSIELLLLNGWSNKLKNLTANGLTSAISTETVEEAKTALSKIKNQYGIHERVKESEVIEDAIGKAKAKISSIQAIPPDNQLAISVGLSELFELVGSIGTQVKEGVSQLKKELNERRESLISFETMLSSTLSDDELIGNAIGLGLLANEDVEKIGDWNGDIPSAQGGAIEPKFLEPLKGLLKTRIHSALDDTNKKIEKVAEMSQGVNDLKEAIADIKTATKEEMAERLNAMSRSLDRMKNENKSWRESVAFKLVNYIPYFGATISNWWYGKTGETVAKEYEDIQRREAVVKMQSAVDLGKVERQLSAQKQKLIDVLDTSKPDERIPSDLKLTESGNAITQKLKQADLLNPSNKNKLSEQILGDQKPVDITEDKKEEDVVADGQERSYLKGKVS